MPEGGEDGDPLTQVRSWVKYVGEPMRREVDGLKRSFWWAAGGFGGAGITMGLFLPYIMKKLGLS